MLRTLLALSFGLFMAAGAAEAQTMLDRHDAAQSVEIRDLTANQNEISGVVVNKSPHVVRNIELRMQYHWLWDNEFHPGANPPGQAVNITLDRELRPGESMPFRYHPEPALPMRSDGRYMPEVSVAGFSVVVPSTMALR